MKPKLISSKYRIVPLIFCILAACSTAPQVTIKTDYDHAATFGQYHTYAIDTASTGLGPTNAAALESSLRSSLAGRGFKESARNADIYIVPTVFTRQQLDVMPGYGVTVYPSRFGRYGGGWAMNAEVQQYTEGSLLIDFVDSKTHKIIFRGLGQAAVSSSTERNAAAIQEAVNKIVAAYPG